MNIHGRWDLSEVLMQIWSVRKIVGRYSCSIKRNRDNLAGNFAKLDEALERVMAAGVDAEEIIDRLLSEEDWTREQSFTAEETERLRHLNCVMNDVSQFMHQTADAIRPVMQAKTADDADPMFDYEIEAKLDYELRDDDLEYDEDIDNYLSSREEHLHWDREEDELNDDWRGSLTPEPFQSAPLSWLLHNLTEHRYGADGPRVDVRDCLRIGRVHLDIQVWWQYVFDVEAGRWIKRWRKPEGVPEYAQTHLFQEKPLSLQLSLPSDR